MKYFCFRNQDGKFWCGYDKKGECQWSNDPEKESAPMKIFPYDSSIDFRRILERHSCLAGCSIVLFELTPVREMNLIVTQEARPLSNFYKF